MPVYQRPAALLALLLLLACNRRPPAAPTPAPPRKPPGKPAAGAPAAPDGARTALAHVPYQPYRIGLATAGLDDEEQAGLVRALGRRWGALLCRFALAPVPQPTVEQLLAAPRVPPLPDALIERLERFDRVLLVGRAAGGAVVAREWLHRLGQLSAPWRGPGATPRHAALEAAEALIGWSARVVAVQGKTVRALACGGGLLFGRPAPLSAGDIGPFDYHRPGEAERYQAVRGSFGRLARVLPAAGGVELELELLGWYTPKPGDRWRRLFLPGGERELRVLSTDGTPQPGMVVYADARNYSKQHDRFAGTTDEQGAVRLSAPAGELRHVQVVSTVEGVEFTFFQGVLPVAGGLAPWVVQIAELSSLRSEAKQVRDRLLSGLQMEALRRRIQALLDTAALLVRNGRFPTAVEKIEQALGLLAGVRNADATKLRQMVARLKKKYEENVARQKLIDSRTAILEVLAKADEAVYAGRFAEGVKLLEQAQARWPAKLFAQRAAQIAARLEQARRLAADQSTELGRARSALLQAVDRLGQEQLELRELQALEARIAKVAEQGVKDVKLPYSDVELLARLKLKLDRIAQGYVVQLKRLTDEYEASDDADRRKQLYEQSERISAYRTQVDRLLQKLVLDR